MNPDERRVEQLEQSQQRQDKEITELKVISERLLTLMEEQAKHQGKMEAKLDDLANAHRELQSTVTAFVDIRRQIGEIKEKIENVEEQQSIGHTELDEYKKEVETSLNELRKPVWGAIYIIGFIELVGVVVGIYFALK